MSTDQDQSALEIKENPGERQILPPAYLLLGLLLILALHFLFPVMKIVPKPWILIGIIPVGLGIWFNIQADRQFRDAQTTIHSFGEPSQFVNQGV